MHFYHIPAENFPPNSDLFTKNVNEWSIKIIKIIKNDPFSKFWSQWLRASSFIWLSYRALEKKLESAEKEEITITMYANWNIIWNMQMYCSFQLTLACFFYGFRVLKYLHIFVIVLNKVGISIFRDLKAIYLLPVSYFPPLKVFKDSLCMILVTLCSVLCMSVFCVWSLSLDFTFFWLPL